MKDKLKSVRVKMDLIHDRNSNILFSLHDSKIRKITFRNNILTLHLNKIFQYTKDGEKIYSGEVLFYDSDLDECSILIFDRTVYEGDFSGKAISLIEYMEEYSNAEFEILIEGYFGYYTTYTGWIWIEGKEPVSAIMYIWNTGDMVYRIDN
ncbi:hypothetical protein GCWU000282_02238 [Catonella morbi ATCC 51271]|uniref:Uncharacterized protein n=2 Tax=Catonella TaxID=43996 RepID=V2XIZ2_9FIRM|nr:hypothetical protein [Catonella morbi]ESL02104.1 hypothetical protein GCWU000282_02238 [Catonella morbi ATCC 51271]